MTSGPTLPLWIGRSKCLFPTVSVAVLLLGFASIRGPRCMVKRAGPGGPDEISRGRPDVPEGTLRWVYYCCVRCKMAPRMVDLRRSLVLGPVLGLVLEPAQAFLASQDVQNLEYAGRRRPSGQRRPQRLGDRAEL